MDTVRVSAPVSAIHKTILPVSSVQRSDVLAFTMSYETSVTRQFGIPISNSTGNTADPFEPTADGATLFVVVKIPATPKTHQEEVDAGPMA